MSIVLSHRTAWLVYHAPHRPAMGERFPLRRSALVPAYPRRALVARARSVLNMMGIAGTELAVIDALVCGDHVRSSDPAVATHLCSCALPTQSVCKLAPGVFVVSPELCFIQMGKIVTDARELIEFGYELCGGYELPAHGGEDYRERPAVASVASIKATIDTMPGMHGIKMARWAIGYVRDGSRSPMETAHVMTLVLPKRLGGLGVRALRMDYRVDVPEGLRQLTKRSYAVCDVCIPRARLDSEYNGFHHDEERRKVEDEERRNVLEAMGYHVKVLTKVAFFDAVSYRRHLTSIMRIARIQKRDLPADFWERQEELRRFVLRRWLGDAEGRAAA